jgi:DNA-binding LacI/PurR family transcriptional regulator
VLTPSYFVAAAPVWRLVRERQRAWGYDDDEMARFLQLGSTIDTRGWMGRPMAERILRRLCNPAPATTHTAETNHRLNLAAAQLDLAVTRLDTIRRLTAAGISLPDIAAELGVTVRTVERVAAEVGLDFSAEERRAS